LGRSEIYLERKSSQLASSWKKGAPLRQKAWNLWYMGQGVLTLKSGENWGDSLVSAMPRYGYKPSGRRWRREFLLILDCRETQTRKSLERIPITIESFAKSSMFINGREELGWEARATLAGTGE